MKSRRFTPLFPLSIQRYSRYILLSWSIGNDNKKNQTNKINANNMQEKGNERGIPLRGGDANNKCLRSFRTPRNVRLTFFLHYPSLYFFLLFSTPFLLSPSSSIHCLEIFSISSEFNVVVKGIKIPLSLISILLVFFDAISNSENCPSRTFPLLLVIHLSLDDTNAKLWIISNKMKDLRMSKIL